MVGKEQEQNKVIQLDLGDDDLNKKIEKKKVIGTVEAKKFTIDELDSRPMSIKAKINDSNRLDYLRLCEFYLDFKFRFAY